MTYGNASAITPEQHYDPKGKLVNQIVDKPLNQINSGFELTDNKKILNSGELGRKTNEIRNTSDE